MIYHVGVHLNNLLKRFHGVENNFLQQIWVNNFTWNWVNQHDIQEANWEQLVQIRFSWQNMKQYPSLSDLYYVLECKTHQLYLIHFVVTGILLVWPNCDKIAPVTLVWGYPTLTFLSQKRTFPGMYHFPDSHKTHPTVFYHQIKCHRKHILQFKQLGAIIILFIASEIWPHIHKFHIPQWSQLII